MFFFLGICLPKYINDLFPPTVPNAGTYVSQIIGADSAVQLVGDLSLQMNQLAASDVLSDTGATVGATTSESTHVTSHTQNIMESMSDVGLVSSMSDVSTTSKKWRMVSKHDRNECLYCARQRNSRMNSSCISSDLNISASTSRKKSYQSQLMGGIGGLDVSYNSPESVFSEESVAADRVSGQILRHIQKLANPVWSKQSKQALLELKNKQPHAFQDICLYSEVCKALGKNTYRPGARRFIQEIFYDLDFDCFFIESNEILVRKELLSDETLEIIETSDNAANFSGELNVITMSKTSSGHATLLASSDKNTINNNNNGHSYSVLGPSSLSATTTTMMTTTAPFTPSTIVKTHLTHFKSPALASVYEASAENLLSESVNSKKSSLKSISVPITQDQQQENKHSFMKKMNEQSSGDVIATTSPTKINEKTVITTSETDTANRNTSSNIFNITNSSNVSSYNRSNYMRPRFNTLELDLSCTKNKFPIRDRSKLLTKDLNLSSGGVFKSSDRTQSLSTTITLGSLYCERRLLQSSQSEDALSALCQKKNNPDQT